MARPSYPVIALVASFVCIASFAISYSNFDGYGDLDPEQNSLQTIEPGGSFSITLDENDQIWVYSEDAVASNASVKVLLDGEIVNGTSVRWYDTFLTSEDGTRVYVPLTKLGPGLDGEFMFENDGSSMLYLVDMVGIGANLWEQTSVQVMAASCCLFPFLAMLGIIGLIRSSRSTKTGPKILIFDSDVGIPTTEDIFNSVNNIPEENAAGGSTPDPWKEEIRKSEERIEEVSEITEEPHSEGLEDNWRTWDEG